MTVTLRLPLTVAIIPALLVRIADGRYAVPLDFVAETTRIASPTDPGGPAEVQYRGRALRVIELGAAWREGWRPGVILDVAGRQGALAVDTLLGQEDIVVGPLDAPRGMPRWINGATILSDGVPALILDPTALV
jgi:two-component system chemotaxis sensor kinase CheA